ncbi:MAG: ADP-ribose diphosphatase, partial [Pseudomonadota bacterium]
MSDRRFEIVGRKRIFDRFLKLDMLHLKHVRFDGNWSPVLERELVVQRRAASVLPYDPRQDVVVLIEQFRPGAI